MRGTSEWNSRQLHQKCIITIMYIFDGLKTFRLRKEVTDWTIRQCSSRQDWDIPVEKAKEVNAENALTDERFALAI